jgi:excisionase family DNA binding protein
VTGPPEVMVAGVDAWAEKPAQLAQLLATPRASIPDPRGQPVDPDQIAYFTIPAAWAESARELADALAVSPVEDRLVFTVEEAAQLLGISRSFAYEAVKQGEIPSMRIGRRILVPKAALQRFLESPSIGTRPESGDR